MDGAGALEAVTTTEASVSDLGMIALASLGRRSAALISNVSQMSSVCRVSQRLADKLRQPLPSEQRSALIFVGTAEQT